MIPSRYPGSYLLTQFREFYREVARLKRTVAYAPPLSAAEEVVFAAQSAAAGAGGGGGTSLVPRTVEASPAVTGVWQQLLSVLERQALEAGQGGAFAYEVYREAQYVMAALADEIFLHLEWEGKSSWPLLESRLFQSHIAGEEVFNRIDRLLQRRDPFYLDLAAVYFMALSLGFEGKYRGADDLDPREYRRQLFRMIYRRDPKLFTATAPLFPQTYQNTLDKSEVKKLPAQWVWVWLIAAVLVLWIGASEYSWASATNRVSCLVCHALDARCTCDPGAGK
jgi:type IV/VI secretion system ImpK/VasF family protein